MEVHNAHVRARRIDEFPDALGQYLVEPVPDVATERPAKRQKVVRVQQHGPPPADQAWDDAVTLARVVLELPFDHSSLGPRYMSSLGVGGAHLSPRRPFHFAGCTLLPQRARKSSVGCKSYLCQLNSSPKEPLCDLIIDASISDDTLENLNRAACMPRGKKGPPPAMAVSFLSTSNADDTMTLSLEIKIVWQNARSLMDFVTDSEQLGLLTALTPSLESHSTDEWVPSDFYNSVHVPSKDGPEAEEAAAMDVEGLRCKLYSFQKRTVKWLLQRENVLLEGYDSEEENTGQEILPHGFFKVTGIGGVEVFVNHWLGIVTTKKQLASASQSRIAGGLLAEEMGLGKTVEVISLMLLNRRDMAQETRKSSMPLRKSSATLIISPQSIQHQWEAEIKSHAPDLRVHIYQGLKAAGRDASSEEILETLLGYDVVLVSYNVLSAEIHFAEATPEKNLRYKKQYEKRTSPLVQIDWWRCVLDECQMVESGVSQAARVANQISRQKAWAVSGTPLKKDAKDLFGLLVFLRLEPYNYSQSVWRRLIEHHKPIFKRLFGDIAIRHSKNLVRADIILPPQKRVVITLPLTPIEEQHYFEVYQEMCDDLSVSLEGVPLNNDWDPNKPASIEKMRAWLSRLRQTVLHPEVGERNRRALGQKDGPLRTVEAVLDVMIEKNDAEIRSAERAYFMAKVWRGKILERGKRLEEALEIWLEAFDSASQAVRECRYELEASSGNEAQEGDVSSTADKTSDAEFPFENDQASSNLSAPRLRMRAALEVQHIAAFSLGNVYFQIKSDEDLTQPDSEIFKERERRETELFEKAKVIRNELLSEPMQKTNKLMHSISSRTFVTIPNCKGPDVTGGIESRAVIDRAAAVCEMMNLQAEKLDDWREKMIQLLLLPLLDQEEEELQGDEYENTTKQQEEAYVYIEALRAAVADRSDALSGQENALIKRDTQVLLRQAHAGEGYSPGLTIALLEERAALRTLPQLGSIRGCISELRAIRWDMQRQQERGSSRAALELKILDLALANMQDDLAKQTKAQAELEKEADLLRNATNARIEYYRNLQVISDAVAPYEPDDNGGLDIDEEMKKELLRLDATNLRFETQLGRLKSRSRYLSHLKSESTAVGGPRNCIICSDPIGIGILLSCGHQFCKECLKHWYRSHRKCPICKTVLVRSDLHPISYKPQEMTIQEEPADQGTSEEDQDSDSSMSLYEGMSSATFAQIRNIDVRGSFGTKIDNLARHIIYLRTSDPGAKCIVFSQFRDFLDILANAFQRFKIGFATIDEKQHGIERFKNDTSVECFFLHAKAHSSGLNLVNATHVFLCEPLINTAIELQAIARVHRIGQHNPTTVYMYLVEDTVEKAIYDISVARRLEHIGRVIKTMSSQKNKANAAAVPAADEDTIDAANSLELQEASLSKLLASGRDAGEVVQKHDLWNCLFGVRAGAKAGSRQEARRAIAGFLGAEAAEGRERTEAD